MFSLAHLSDVHLASLPRPEVRELLSKRAIGFASWQFRRRRVQKRHIADLIAEDIKSAQPDHIALTGDLVNIALPKEFELGKQWLNRFGSGDQISFVPGNHDAYVHILHDAGIGTWGEYMTPDLSVIPASELPADRPGFPYVRQRRNVALIGVSTGVPAAWNRASGTIGKAQMEALEKILGKLHERGFCRVIMLHHPALPGQSPQRKALEDAEDLAEVLHQQGAEFVLHGHLHVHMHEAFATRTGTAHVIGVPSASANDQGRGPAAAWNCYRIRRVSGVWQADVTVRTYHAESNKFVPERNFTLSTG